MATVRGGAGAGSADGMGQAYPSGDPGAGLEAAGLGLADEGGLLPGLGDGGGVDVAHARAEAADQLGDDAGDGALEGELHLLALGDVLVEGVTAALDLEAGGGRAQGGHAPEDLVLAALAADDLAGALGAAGEQAADHDRARPGGDRLGHVARVADAAVGDQGDAGGLGDLGAVEDGGELGHADPGDQAGGAGEARPDPDLDGVGPGLGQVAEAVGGGDVAGHDLAVRPGRLQLADGLDGVVGVAVGDVDDQGVDVGVEQGLGPGQVAAADPEGGRDPQAALAVAGRLRAAARAGRCRAG